MQAWTLTCRACGRELSVPLTAIEVSADPHVPVEDGGEVIPTGCAWWAQPGFAELHAVRGGDLMCRRADLPVAVLGKASFGCCGPDGLDGPNLECPCGVAFATEMGDCWQPHVVAVDPDRVERVPAAPAVKVHVYPPAGRARATAWELAAWLHEVLGAEDWYGTDLDRLAAEWASRASTPVVLVWVDADREAREGVEVDALIGKLEGGPITVVRARSLGASAASSRAR